MASTEYVIAMDLEFSNIWLGMDESGWLYMIKVIHLESV